VCCCSANDVVEIFLNSKLWVIEVLAKVLVLRADEVFGSPHFVELDRAKVCAVVRSDGLEMWSEIEVRASGLI